MILKKVQIRGMESSIWLRAKIATIKRIEKDPNMCMAKWITEAIRVKLRKENG